MDRLSYCHNMRGLWVFTHQSMENILSVFVTVPHGRLLFQLKTKTKIASQTEGKGTSGNSSKTFWGYSLAHSAVQVGGGGGGTRGGAPPGGRGGGGGGDYYTQSNYGASSKQNVFIPRRFGYNTITAVSMPCLTRFFPISCSAVISRSHFKVSTQVVLLLRTGSSAGEA